MYVFWKESNGNVYIYVIVTHLYIIFTDINMVHDLGVVHWWTDLNSSIHGNLHQQIHAVFSGVFQVKNRVSLWLGAAVCEQQCFAQELDPRWKTWTTDWKIWSFLRMKHPFLSDTQFGITEWHFFTHYTSPAKSIDRLMRAKWQDRSEPRGIQGYPGHCRRQLPKPRLALCLRTPCRWI